MPMPMPVALMVMRMGVRVHGGSVVDAGVEPVTPDNADAPLDPVAMARDPAAHAFHRALLGAGQSRRHPARLVAAHARRGVAEIALRSRFGAIGADPGLGDVEIDSMIRRLPHTSSIQKVNHASRPLRK